MNLILFDDQAWEELLPLTFTKPVSKLRVGILTIEEKWEKLTGLRASWLTRPHLQNKYPLIADDDNLLINSMILPDKSFSDMVLNSDLNQVLVQNGRLLSVRLSKDQLKDFNPEEWINKGDEYNDNLRIIEFPWHIFGHNGDEIESDFELLIKGRTTKALSDTVNVIEPGNVFVEEGFKGEFFTVNASSGSVYLGRDSEIMEGSVIRGPFALCEGSTVKLSAKIYGPTTIGPWCKAGGEINNSVLQAYSNKGHDGFLGNAVIGEWCNLGADTNNSNLKNNYSEVKMWSYTKNRGTKTGLQFCGLIMGDHSKCGINTMFNTGTLIGVSANIFGPGFPKNFIPSFSWGGAQGMTDYRIDKALETVNLVLECRNLQLEPADIEILEWVYEDTAKYRK